MARLSSFFVYKTVDDGKYSRVGRGVCYGDNEQERIEFASGQVELDDGDLIATEKAAYEYSSGVFVPSMVSPDELFRQTKRAAEDTDFVFEQLPQRFYQFEFHPVFQTADIVVRLDSH